MKRRRRAGCDRKARKEAPEHAVADDQVWRGAAGNCVLGSGGERQQDAAFGQPLRHFDRAGARNHHATRRAAEQAARVLVAGRSGDEDALAEPMLRRLAHLNDATNGFVPGHQRVAHSGKGRHAACPEQLFGARADPAPLDLDDDVVGGGRLQLEPTQRNLLRFFEDDGNGVHGRLLPHPKARKLSQIMAASQRAKRSCGTSCKFILTLDNVNAN
jgi:hypothetical protein